MRETMHGLFIGRTIRVQNDQRERFELTTRQPIEAVDDSGWIDVFYDKEKFIGKWSLTGKYGWVEILRARQLYR